MFLNPLQVIGHLPIPYGGRAGDFGTGAGNFAEALAERVGPSGTVYALDAFSPVLDSVSRAVTNAGATCFAIAADFNLPIPLRDKLLHAAVVSNIMHAVKDRMRFVSELSRVMEPRGRILFVDWIASFRNMGPPEESVLTPAEAIRLFRANGFTTDDMLPAGTHHFAFVATSS